MIVAMEILTKSVAQRNFVLAVAIAAGYKWHGQRDRDSHMTSPEAIEAEYPFDDYPMVYISEVTREIAGSGRLGHEYSKQAILDFMIHAHDIVERSGKITSVKLSDEYCAELTEEGVKVGCQSVSKSKLQEVNKMVFGKEVEV